MDDERVTQAVILAGGRGERLRPLTDTIPKPMVPIHSRPFLEYLIELLKQNGIQEIVLLLGYLQKKITKHLGDGSQFGVSIRYSIGTVEDDTGLRLKNAKHLLNEKFLLMYCDNYWPLNLSKLESYYSEKDTEAVVVVYRNARGITNNNMRVEDNGIVSCYDSTRTMSGLNGVDIGFFILRKNILSSTPLGNFSFQQEIIPKLVSRRQLAAYMTDQGYFSVGSPDRLLQTAAFLLPRKIILLDRDGVINRKPQKADYVKTWSEFIFLPRALEAIRHLTAAGFEVYIITNQPGIARGVMSKEDLDEINRTLHLAVKHKGGRIDGIYQCLHGWDEGCECRKPKPGLLLDAAFEHSFDLTKAIFIGDNERDILAGEAAECRTLLVDSSHDLFDRVQPLL